MRQRKTLTQIAQERRDPDRLALAAAAAAGGSGVMTHHSTTTGARSWLAYAPVPSTGWSLQITFVRNDVPRQVEEVRRQGIWIVVTLIGFLALAGIAGASALSGLLLPLLILLGIALALHFILRREIKIPQNLSDKRE